MQERDMHGDLDSQYKQQEVRHDVAFTQSDISWFRSSNPLSDTHTSPTQEHWDDHY